MLFWKPHGVIYNRKSVFFLRACDIILKLKSQCVWIDGYFIFSAQSTVVQCNWSLIKHLTTFLHPIISHCFVSRPDMTFEADLGPKNELSIYLSIYLSDGCRVSASCIKAQTENAESSWGRCGAADVTVCQSLLVEGNELSTALLQRMHAAESLHATM